MANQPTKDRTDVLALDIKGPRLGIGEYSWDMQSLCSISPDVRSALGVGPEVGPHRGRKDAPGTEQSLGQ